LIVFGDTNTGGHMSFQTRSSGDDKIVFHNQSTSANNFEIRNTGALSIGWHHCVAVQDGTAVKPYVDGVELTTFDGGSGGNEEKWIESYLDNARIGCRRNNNNSDNGFFTGNIMEVALWNVALTEAQVQSLYYEVSGTAVGRTADTIPSGLRAYYPLSGTVVTNAAVATDEKATLVTTKDAGWTTTGTYSISNNELEGEGSQDEAPAGHGIFDLQHSSALNGSNASDTAWVLRMKIHWTALSHTTDGKYAIIGISDNTSNNTVSEDTISIRMGSYNAGGNNYRKYTAQYRAGSTSDQQGTPTSFRFSADSTQWIELIRDGSTVTFNVSTASDYTTGKETHTVSISGTVNDLRYIQVQGNASSWGNDTGDMTFEVDDIEFYNGVTTASGTPTYETSFANSSDLPENTLFDETDTYKTWWLQDNTWKGYVTRGVFVGGEASTVMDYIAIDTLSNAATFGATTSNHSGGGGMGNGTIGVIAGFTSSNANVMQYITIATLGDVSTFGNLTTSRYGSSAVDDQSRGVISGGYDNGSSSYVNVIDYITIGTLGNATAWGGTATTTRSGGAGNLNNNTIGMFAGGYSNGGDVIDYVTIQTTGICSDYGDMIQARTAAEGVSSLSTGRGILAGGNVTSTKYNIIEYMAIGTTGTSYDFGDLSAAASGVAGVSNNTRACFGGGATPTKITTIDYITMATLGVVGDFGDLTVARTDAKGVQG